MPDAHPLPVTSVVDDGGGDRKNRSPLPYFLTLIFFVSAFNQGDRLLIGIVSEPIKREFGLTDTMMGLLSGTAFALVYPPLGLPIAWFADRFNRKNILAACLAFWSAMTALAGLAAGYWQLVAARLGVAAGEAGFVPPSHSLIADYVSEARRARAFSILVAGGAAGGMFANIIGGAATEAYGWRAAFIALGVPGVLFALLVAFTLKEPPRIVAPPSSTHAKSGPSLLHLLRNGVFVACVLGSACHLMYQYAAAAWAAPFYIRTFGLKLGEVGLLVGVTGAIATLVGGVAGGFIGDWLARYNRRWLAFWPAISVLLAVPFGVAGFLSPTANLALGLLLVSTLLNALYQASTYSLVQSMAGGSQRASAAALMIFVQNLIGLGLGPLLVGMASDALSAEHGKRALGFAMGAANAFNILAVMLFVVAGLSMRSGAVERRVTVVE